MLISIILGVLLLYLGAYVIVRCAVVIAQRLQLSPFVIGFLILGISTSLPEFFVSCYGVYSGYYDIVFGTIVGSNIFDISMTMGLCLLCCPVVFSKECRFFDAPFMLLACCGCIPICIWGLNLALALLFLLLFGCYIYNILKRNTPVDEYRVTTSYPTFIFLLLIFGAIATMKVGSDLLIKGIVALSATFGLSHIFSGTSIVAIATSFPEMCVTIVAILERRYRMIIGGIVGSNIYNVLFIFGVIGLFGSFNVTNVAFMDVYIMLFVHCIFIIHLLCSKTCSKVFALFLFFFYPLYLFLRLNNYV